MTASIDCEMTKFGFIVPTNKEEILSRNFLKSKIVRDRKHSVILQRGFSNIGKAYNDGMKKLDAELAICLHQDVFLPDDWEDQVLGSLEKLKRAAWGVLGPAGIIRVGKRRVILGHVQDRGKEIGPTKDLPAKVETLDELLLIVKNNGQLLFDEQIPSAQHFFGADICLQAASKSLGSFAINAYCHHNSVDGNADTPAFRASLAYMQKKWKRRLPFVTTCALVESKFKENLRHVVNRLGLKPLANKGRQLAQSDGAPAA